MFAYSCEIFHIKPIDLHKTDKIIGGARRKICFVVIFFGINNGIVECCCC